MPSPAARRIGKMNVQKTASGSRMNSRKRTSVSCTIELRMNPRSVRDNVDSLIAQVPSGQRDEHVFQRHRCLARLRRREMRDVNRLHQLAWTAQCYHAAMIDDRYAIAEPLRLL